ncbi:hypothetical protein [Flagellimonas nanhaiensis]|uniref:Uncharacterized protein n=1 Tax=Flagellimonas nanhaiensis TaxID=2292706 RepID=A0A371JMW4_9FLAO|nr:hypothetical protein [Allomuricauda nanhaiensis]RDY58481.1 hypothetical protein DX873_15890 [Allomuricauda nanhaiensis]
METKTEKLQLKVEQIIGYIPFGLQVQGKRHLEKYGEVPILKVNGIANQVNEYWQYEFLHDDGDLSFTGINDENYKPLLIPLSKLINDIEAMRVDFGFKENNKLRYLENSKDAQSIQNLEYSSILFLLKNQYDFQFLIDKSLAIEIK